MRLQSDSINVPQSGRSNQISVCRQLSQQAASLVCKVTDACIVTSLTDRLVVSGRVPANSSTDGL